MTQRSEHRPSGLLEAHSQKSGQAWHRPKALEGGRVVKRWSRPQKRTPEWAKQDFSENQGPHWLPPRAGIHPLRLDQESLAGPLPPFLLDPPRLYPWFSNSCQIPVVRNTF